MIPSHNSLRKQLSLIIGLTLLVIAGIYSAVLFSLEHERNHGNLNQIEILLRVLVEQRIEELSNDLFANYNNAMALTLEHMRTVDNLLILTTYQPDGSLFVSTDASIQKDLAAEWVQQLTDKQSTLTQTMVWRGQEVLMYVQRLEMIGEHIGYIQIIYDLTDQKHQRELSWALFVSLFIATVLILALLLNYALAKLVLAPLNTLREAMQIVANEKFIEPVQLNVNNELKEMADSFNTMATAVIHSRYLIERQVSERTAQLAEANQEIRLLNDQLHSENRRLGSELSVSRRLQSMLLPSHEELLDIEPLEIAGMMMPSQEVGGDYYDVFSTENFLVCGIGDVTGHGLESGVLAMMVQTAIRALLTQPDLPLTDCLVAVNQTIFQNVQRLRTDRTLSLLLLTYEPDTYQLTMTGQHESVVLVRGGELTCLDTLDLGFPIGLEPNIRDFVHHYRCQLDIDDVVVLYTDGITEAENADGDYYGLPRLLELIKSVCHEPPLSMKQMILNDLWGFIGDHTLLDDITLVILKRSV